MILIDDRVTDPLRARPVRQLAVNADSLPLAERLLFHLELVGHLEQARGPPLGRHHSVEEGEMVAEEKDRGRVVDPPFRPQETVVEARRPRCDVLVREAMVRSYE